MTDNPQIKAPIRMYTAKELADMYGMHPRTLKKHLEKHKKRIGAMNGRYYTVKQVVIIFGILGHPMVAA